jgi:osmotically-inducible protein OsmY
MNISDNEIINNSKDQLLKTMKTTTEGINIHCVQGIVTLSGFVNVLFEKNKAEEIVRKIQGVKNVINNITISLDGNCSDKQLTELANKNLRNCPFSHRLLGVTAKVSGGSALLVGDTATERDREIAILEVSKTYGIVSVTSDINLSTFKNDISINNDVNMVFMQSKINVNNVSFDVEKGKVTLYGIVEKKEDIERLVTLAEAIPGVKCVKNNLQVSRVPTGIL